MISLRSPSESTTSLYLCSTFSYLKVSLLLRARTLQRIFVYQLYKESITIHLSLASSFFSFCFFFFFQISSWTFLSGSEYIEMSPIWRNNSTSNNNNKAWNCDSIFLSILPYSSSSLYSKNFPKVAFIYYLQFLIL